jgi:myosin protein heavy chain
LDSSLSEKSLLDTENERLRPDARQSHNLTSEIEEQQKILKEEGVTIKKLAEEPKLVKHHLLDPPNIGHWNPQGQILNL